MKLYHYPPQSAYKSSSGVPRPGKVTVGLTRAECVQAFREFIERRHGKMPEGDEWCVDMTTRKRMSAGAVFMLRYKDQEFMEMDPWVDG